MLIVAPEVADLLFGLSNIAAIIGGVLVVVGAAGIFWFGSIREHYGDKRLQANELATATANNEAAASNERNTALQIELEKERSARLKLEERLAPRRLQGLSRDKFKAAAKPFHEMKIRLGVSPNNPEGDALLNEMGEALMEAGWARSDIDRATEFGTNYPDGVTVLISSQDQDAPPSLALALGDALKEIGFAGSAPIALADELSVGQVKIAMGFKPGRHGG